MEYQRSVDQQYLRIHMQIINRPPGHGRHAEWDEELMGREEVSKKISTGLTTFFSRSDILNYFDPVSQIITSNGGIRSGVNVEGRNGLYYASSVQQSLT